MNASMFLRSASMQGAMLPLMSTTNTISATPLVFARACGTGAEAAGAATPCDASASAGWIGAVAGAVASRLRRASDRPGGTTPEKTFRCLSETYPPDAQCYSCFTPPVGQGRSRRRDNSRGGAKFRKESAGIVRLNITTLGFLVRRDFLGDRHKRQTRARPTGQTRGAEGVQARREIGEKRKRVGGAGWSGRRGQGVKFACSRLSRDHRESRARDDFRSLPGRPHAGASTLKEGAAWPTRLRTHKRSVCHGMPIWSTAGLAGAASRFGC